MTSKSTIRAIAVFQGKIRGKVIFEEDSETNNVNIEIDLEGLRRNHHHGFHIHTYGDMSEGCTSMCAHFNPYGRKHGGPDCHERHVGDLGNITGDANGRCKCKFWDTMIRLRGTKSNIIGRGLVIHEDMDDLGLGETPESLITGNAGKRIACAVIGYARP